MSKCDSFVYRKLLNGNIPYCDYLEMTNSRRPCPPGESCTAYVKREVHRKKVRTPEEQQAFLEEQKRKRAEKNRAWYERNKEAALARNRKWQKEHREYLNRQAREKRAKAREEREENRNL